ncbi:helix-turn-helix domain-containing protein [Arthrobacter sp. H20]|uniref:helix-turn-helix domain-containing protein n=1 Tax=Arthrobacter sp. H20 TaxID=1267981 RepID=UPI00047EDBA1|nr:helix-turn-helix domain-containing protein [Arthrobacter sp. H20]
MPLAAHEFQRWSDARIPGQSVREISQATGIKWTTVHQQIVRGKVAEATVVAVARAYEIPPLSALSDFELYADLASGVKPPTDAELISQIHYLDILREVLVRADELLPFMPGDLRAFPHADSLRAWIDAIDPGDLRTAMAARLGVTSSTFSSRLKRSLPADIAVDVARHTGISLASGLIVTGLLTENEGGWPPEARLNALHSLSDSELLCVAAQKLSVQNRKYWGKDHDRDQAKEFWDNLG